MLMSWMRIAMLAVWLSGCGVPEEMHQATLDELKKARQELAALRERCRDVERCECDRDVDRR